MTSNVNVVKTPHLYPYSCCKCGATESSREFFVDIGANLEYGGVVYVCCSCMVPVGEGSGLFITIERSLKEVEMYKEKSDKYFELLVKLRTWGDAFEKLTGFGLEDFFANLEKVMDNGQGLSGTSESVSDSKFGPHPSGAGINRQSKRSSTADSNVIPISLV